MLDRRQVPTTSASCPIPRGGSRAADTSRPLREFLRTEEGSGLLLLAAAVLALVWANSPLHDSYRQLWGSVFSIRVGGWEVAKDLRHWVNDGLMALFFLVVGLEIKREVTTGELREPRKLALPAMAALGGMVVPATLYLLVNAGGETRGWGVTVATDIAFALGVLTLAASRAPRSLRSFLLTLAIVDDIGAILVIALFYSGGIALESMLIAAMIVAAVVGARSLRVSSVLPYAVLGVALWVAVDASGIHPAITGVILGLLTPAVALRRPRTAGEDVRWAARESLQDAGPPGADAPYWLYAADVSREAVSPLARVEHALHPWTSRAVLPTFALANAGVELGDGAAAAVGPVGGGILLGLVLGKPLGIAGAVWVATRLGLGRLPESITSRMVFGAGAVAGIGFTVALFMTDLGFTHPRVVEGAKLAVLAASLVAGVLGTLILAWASRSPERSRG